MKEEGVALTKRQTAKGIAEDKETVDVDKAQKQSKIKEDAAVDLEYRHHDTAAAAVTTSHARCLSPLP